jgi:short-subunit dehydrogenase
VGAKPRAYWGAYGASKAALENLALSYADEVQNLSRVKVAIVDPGRTRTAMRAKAYPGEDPETLKEPAVVAEAVADLMIGEFETGYRLVFEE